MSAPYHSTVPHGDPRFVITDGNNTVDLPPVTSFLRGWTFREAAPRLQRSHRELGALAHQAVNEDLSFELGLAAPPSPDRPGAGFGRSAISFCATAMPLL